MGGTYHLSISNTSKHICVYIAYHESGEGVYLLSSDVDVLCACTEAIANLACDSETRAQVSCTSHITAIRAYLHGWAHTAIVHFV